MPDKSPSHGWVVTSDQLVHGGVDSATTAAGVQAVENGGSIDVHINNAPVPGIQIYSWRCNARSEQLVCVGNARCGLIIEAGSPPPVPFVLPPQLP